jgi:hypothetical protein
VLICKGAHVSFRLQNGRLVHARGSMLHDPSGDFWPKDSMLVTTFRRSGRPATDEEKSGDPTHYLGREHQAHVGSVKLPPQAISEWKRVGQVATIYYERPGTRAPGRFYHHFGKRRLEAFFKKGSATVYRRGSAYRLEMGVGSIATHNGIVFP